MMAMLPMLRTLWPVLRPMLRTSRSLRRHPRRAHAVASDAGWPKVIIGMAAGALVSYLLDPRRGRARWTTMRDRAGAELRRDRRRLTQRVHYERGRMTGVVHRLSHKTDGPPPDDRALVDRVRSMALGRIPDLAHNMTIDACNGVVTLRGQLDNLADIGRAEAAVRRVPGVDRVENLLHLQGENAPNKAQALRAHG